MLRDYLFDVAKIVEGASNGDYDKVYAYAEALGEKLDTSGEKAAAKRIRQILGKSKAGQVSLARAGQLAHLPVDSESRIPVADEDFFPKGEVALFLAPDARDVVDRFLKFFRAADRLIANGVGISPSLLMHGAPGVGKTQLAKFIASELRYPLITARSDALISSYLGSTAKNLRLLFEHAASRPCVLFLDEFDAIAKMRDDDRELGELKRVVISLMQNIDAMGRDHVLLAATNHEHLLDPAIWRRFAYKLNLVLPDYQCRHAMLTHFLGDFADEAAVDVAAALVDGMSGAEIRDISEDLIRSAVVNDRTAVGQADVVSKLTGSAPLHEQLQKLRRSSPKLFTQKKLADLFGITQPYVCGLLKRVSKNES